MVPADTDEHPRVILPGQSGMLAHGAEEEFVVEAVYMHPREGLMYRGRRVGKGPGAVVTSFPAGRVRPIPGLSRLGRYDFETGETTADIQDA